MSELETRAFWHELVRLKDELSLAELSRRFGATPGEVSAALERTGVLRNVAVTAVAVGDLDDLPPEPGEGPDAAAFEPDDGILPEVARALRSLRPGSKDMLIGGHAALLGRVPDADVARAAGVSIRTIASFRARHAIPGYRGPRRKPEPASQRRSRIEPFAHLIGQVEDEDVAEKAGVSVAAVRAWRSRLTSASSASSGSKAWRVTWQSGSARSHGVLLADGLDDALARMERSGLGTVVAVELLGTVLP